MPSQSRGVPARYIDAAGIAGDAKKAPVRTIDRPSKELSRRPLPQANAYAMVQRLAVAAKIGTHTFRATGITAYLKNGGTLERAATMANHSSSRTTQLHDRRSGEVTPDEVEIVLTQGWKQSELSCLPENVKSPIK